MSFISFLEVPSLVGLAVEERRKAPWSFCGVRHSEITVLKSPDVHSAQSWEWHLPDGHGVLDGVTLSGATLTS